MAAVAGYEGNINHSSFVVRYLGWTHALQSRIDGLVRMRGDQLPGGTLSSIRETFRVKTEDNHVMTCEVFLNWTPRDKWHYRSGARAFLGQILIRSSEEKEMCSEKPF